jgi:hypothetical protein
MAAWDFVLTGLFTGIGVATGGAVVELWVKPHLQDFKNKKHKEKVQDFFEKLGDVGKNMNKRL